ncbi:unnamed protein product [Heligmosomoides polygyrus]|uniref:C-type lectin domain-containing protein n=1 Tax=Heligmosomoides polygyrus TaxID=6339 RepID=A0A183GHB3_HELPZ|nr:unnamed protein product [Heligmosomoides polygyrus]
MHSLSWRGQSQNEKCSVHSKIKIVQRKFFPKKVMWEQVEKECRDNGANLASVLSKAENQFIYELSKKYPNNDRLWIGLL